LPVYTAAPEFSVPQWWIDDRNAFPHLLERSPTSFEPALPIHFIRPYLIEFAEGRSD